MLFRDQRSTKGVFKNFCVGIGALVVTSLNVRADICDDFPEAPECLERGGGRLPQTPKEPICKLDQVAKDWTKVKFNLVSRAATNADRIINGLEAAIALEANPDAPDIDAEAKSDAADMTLDKFGQDEATQKANRQITLDSFKNAKTILWDVIKVNVGSADPTCTRCFALRDWTILRTVAAFSQTTYLGYANKVPGATKRIGLGDLNKIQKTDDRGKGDGKPDSNFLSILLGEITEKSFQTSNARA